MARPVAVLSQRFPVWCGPDLIGRATPLTFGSAKATLRLPLAEFRGDRAVLIPPAVQDPLAQRMLDGALEEDLEHFGFAAARDPKRSQVLEWVPSTLVFEFDEEVQTEGEAQTLSDAFRESAGPWSARLANWIGVLTDQPAMRASHE